MKLHIKIEKLQIHQALDIYEIMQMILRRERDIDIQTKEHFWTISLNNGNKILSIELVSMGSISATVVTPTSVLSVPLQKQAAGVILVHNHPSGKLTPSEADKDLTDNLIQACRIMHIPVLDHVIITQHSYYSFKDSGLLAHLELSTKYVPKYELEKQFYEDNIREVESAVKEEKLNTARKMLLNNKSLEEIIELTELSRQEIENLEKSSDI